MKLRILLIILLTSPLNFYSQTILSGSIEVDDIPKTVSSSIHEITNLNELKNRIRSGGDLILKGVKLIIPANYGDLSWTLTNLTFENSTIITNGNSLTIISHTIKSINSRIQSFEVNSIKKGIDGSYINLYNIKQFDGKLNIDISGNNGANGKNGYRGRNSRSKWGVNCRRHATSGGNGRRGQDGGSGGVLSIFTVYNPVNTNPSFIKFSSKGGKFGKGGKRGAGGRNSGPCQFSRGPFASSGKKDGEDGKNGKDGKIIIKDFILTDLIN